MAYTDKFDYTLANGETVKAEFLTMEEIDGKTYAVFCYDDNEEHSTVSVHTCYVVKDSEGYDELIEIDDPMDAFKIMKRLDEFLEETSGLPADEAWYGPLEAVQFDITIPQFYEPITLSFTEKLKSASDFYKKAKDYYVHESYQRAFKEFQKAHAKGYPNLRAELDNCYLQKERIAWLRYYESLAEQGNVDAQYKLGRIWEDGIEFSKDEYKAEKWYTKAAEQGHPESQYLLGRLFHKKYHFTADYLHYAYYWLNKAMENGCNRASVEIRKVQSRDLSMVTHQDSWKQWFDSVDASYRNDAKLSHKKCIAAADNGCSAAAYHAGNNYRYGYGCEKNGTLMRMYYSKAAEQSNDAAMIALTWCYAEGDGIEQDDSQAYYWANRAQECNTLCGYTVLGQYYRWKKDPANGDYFLTIAANGGEPEALFELGYYHKAAAKGYLPAKIREYGEGYYYLTYTFGPAIWFLLNDEWVSKFRGQVYINAVGTKHGDIYDSQLEILTLYAWLYDMEDEDSAKIFQNVMSYTPEYKKQKLQFVRYKYPYASYRNVDQYRLVFQESLPIPIYINSKDDLNRFFSTFSECLCLYLGKGYHTGLQNNGLHISKN